MTNENNLDFRLCFVIAHNETVEHNLSLYIILYLMTNVPTTLPTKLKEIRTNRANGSSFCPGWIRLSGFALTYPT